MSDERATVVDELFTQRRINYPRRRVVVKGIQDLFQADLMFLPDTVHLGKTYKYALVVINCFSKKVWCVPLANKTSDSVTEAMEGVLKQTLPPKHLHTDKGTEFVNPTFKSLMQKYGINHYFTFSEKKAQMAERVIRTLKLWLNKEFYLRGNTRWYEILNDVVDKYNSKIHRSTGVRPNEVSVLNELKILERLSDKRETKDRATKKKKTKPRFRVGDSVRISRLKQTFEKGHTYNWSPEIYIVTEVRDKDYPVTYKIKDQSENEIQGQFYEQELLIVKYKDVYLVEKVLAKRRNMMKVRWLGFDKSSDSWVKISDSYF